MEYNLRYTVKYYVFLFLLFIGFDQETKTLALYGLKSGAFGIWDGLRLCLTFNKGVSFSLFSNISVIGYYFLISFMILLIMFFLVYTYSEYISGNNIFFEVMVLAGAISNIFDRYLYGAVIDFIEFSIFGYIFPTFNFADALIFIGVFGILMQMFILKKRGVYL